MASTVKLVKWNEKEFLKHAEDRTNVFLLEVAKQVKSRIEREVPVDTGNLRDSTVIDNYKETKDNTSVEVGSDEDKAPYAPFVFFPGVTRNYKGNDWIARALLGFEGALPPLLREFEFLINSFEE